MTIPCHKIVLSDKLYSIYKKASCSCSLSSKERKAYESLIGNIELDILTNAEQIQRCKDSHNLPEEIYDDLYPALITVDEQKDLSLNELSKQTLFKLIVTLKEEDIYPPYYNLRNQHIKRNYTITRLHNEDRKSLQDYLTILLHKADKVLIHDNYFAKKNNNKHLFNLFPTKTILVQYVENSDGDNGTFIQDACSGHGDWTVQPCDTTQSKFNRFARSHDRYLIIDDKIEVTLTSGFSYIWSKEKEITCIIREYKEM
ncbi:MAG: hypothetical protein OCC45_08625 [Desulfotalea sp.]